MRAAFDRYEFHLVYHALVDFTATTLSAFYLDILKDRLYASRAASLERRSAQTALHRIARAVATLAAPILPFTAEEIWKELPGPKEESVHLARFETLSDQPEGIPSREAWERLTQLREEAAVMLEQARREKQIGSSLEGAIVLTPSRRPRPRPRRDGNGRRRASPTSSSCPKSSTLPDAAGDGWTESRVYPGLRLKFRKAAGRRCDRCWKVTPEARERGALRPVPRRCSLPRASPRESATSMRAESS